MEKGKLVRDKIPEVIKNKGKTPITHIANNDEYLEKLKEKLQEEVSEFSKNDSGEELADVLEVINSICKFKNINKEKLDVIRKNKEREKGSFNKRIILEKVR